MKKIKIVFILALIANFSMAQVLSPTVVATGGGYFATASASVSFTIGETVIESYSAGSVGLTQGFQQGGRIPRITGQMTYNNALNSPLNGAKIYLKTLAGIVADSAVTNSAGQFIFYNVNTGTYVFNAATTIPLGSVNAVDAQIVLKHFVHMTTLTGMNKTAGDLDLSNYINSIDALYIAKRFTFLINSFPSGDWLFTKDTITVAAFPFAHNLKALCFGDVNSSYIPPLKTDYQNSLTKAGTQKFSDLNHVEIPVIAEEAVSLGSVSWVMELPENGFEVKDVRMNTGKGQLVYNVSGHELRLCWYSAEPIYLKNSDTVFFINAQITDDLLKQPNSIEFKLTQESVFSDQFGRELSQLPFRYPSLDFTGNPGEFFISSNYPNPVQDITSFRIGLPEDAAIMLRIFDLPGQEIRSVDLGNMEKGVHELQFNLNNLAQGTYIYHIEAETSAKKFTATGKIEVSR